MGISYVQGTVRRLVSECHVSLPDGEGHTPVVLGQPGDAEPLLGVVTLEILGLVFDPFHHDRAAQQQAPSRGKLMTPDGHIRPTLTRSFRRAHIVRMALRVLRGPFTVDAYQRLAELGVLREDDRVELIDGQVVEMSPIGERHASCVRRLINLFAPNLLDVAALDAQNPVVLGTHDAPQPDLVVLKRRAGGYASHPQAGDVLLVVEVADTSVAYDREIKMPRYARAAVAEAWLVDLGTDGILVHREPVAGEYASVRLVGRGDTITPLHLPHVTLSVDDVLG